MFGKPRIVCALIFPALSLAGLASETALHFSSECKKQGFIANGGLIYTKKTETHVPHSSPLSIFSSPSSSSSQSSDPKALASSTTSGVDIQYLPTKLETTR
ncbi:uncharacterized protein FPRO_09270 [Fusarium proliferatum ET1]|uniref:Uncharacterized protein n=1 Tax=Fusarium proliferatum (strain ET1) TaxID=1227346 RepID=A0A1L7VN76_FUSPR|nr:uncharacterized protein FPRO_09270 [Fusarium proliferatum ET1]CZR41969.1 uncharacterized protein FPRO_09270 [Fusarium proliferatum ET1]